MSDQSYSALTDAIVRAIAANNFRVPTDITGVVSALAIGSFIKSAGRKTDADLTDRTISVADGFDYISIINDGPAELLICIDAFPTAGVNVIYIKDGEVFEEAISGSALNYTIQNQTCVFRYVLR